MKTYIGMAFVGMLVMMSMHTNPVAAQSKDTDKTLNKSIPDGVTKIFEGSCVKCHFDAGNNKAMARFNLTKWDEFSPGKQAKKANAVVNMVTKEKMPPEKFRQKHPESVPDKAEIKTLKEWAESLKK
jgi:hypothetical protein